MVACVRFRSAFRCSGGDSAEGGRRRLAPVDRRIISGCPSALEASAGPAIGGGAVRCDDGHGALYGRTLRRDGLAWNLQGVLVLNYPFNRFFYLEAELSQHFFVAKTIGLSILLDPVLWIAGSIGAYLCARGLLRRDCFSPRDECKLWLLWIGIGYFGFLFFNRFPLAQYFIVLLPLLALFAAELLDSVREGWQAVVLRRSILCMPLVLIAVLLLYPSNREQLNVQEFVLRRTTGDQSVFVPPAFNPIFRRDGAYFWYNGDLISGAYQEYLRREKNCAGNKLVLDEHRWKATPPAFVFLHLPADQPYRWSSRESGYSPTRIPSLLKRDDGSAPNASVAAGVRAPQ